MATATAPGIGHITQVIGSTFDVEYPEDQLPAIYNAVKLKAEHKGVKVDLTGEAEDRRRLADQVEGEVGGREVLLEDRPVAGPLRQPMPEHEPVVTEILRTGYSWKGQVLRPAMVKVRG